MNTCNCIAPSTRQRCKNRIPPEETFCFRHQNCSNVASPSSSLPSSSLPSSSLPSSRRLKRSPLKNNFTEKLKKINFGRRLATLDDINEIFDLVNQGADVNVKDENGMDILYKVRYLETNMLIDTKIIEFLIDHGADVNDNTHNGTVLMDMVQYNLIDLVKFLVEHDADVNIKNSFDQTALSIAIHNSHLDIAQYLIDHGAEVNTKIISETLSHRAVYYGDWDIVKLLIDNGVDINTRDRFGNTILMNAIRKRYSSFEFIKHLIDKSDIEIKNDNGETALTFAAHNFEILKYLVEKNANIDDSLVLLRVDDVEEFEYLLDHGANINIQNSDGETALMKVILVHRSYLEVYEKVKFLIQRGADIFLKNSNNKIAEQIAFEEKFPDVYLQLRRCRLACHGYLEVKKYQFIMPGVALATMLSELYPDLDYNLGYLIWQYAVSHDEVLPLNEKSTVFLSQDPDDKSPPIPFTFYPTRDLPKIVFGLWEENPELTKVVFNTE